MKDAAHLKRKFNPSWLETYSPWLAYSERLKGPLCKFCVMFPPNAKTVKGVIGSFMVRPFQRYHVIHEQCKKHVETHYHKDALESARIFLENLPVDVQINKYNDKVIEENKKFLKSLVSCISFCGSYDLPLRGKTSVDGVLQGLINLRIDAGDVQLQNHLERAKKNANYQSVQIQNELINICGDIVRDEIIEKVKQAEAYTILADETADISGVEQLSIGLRYFSEDSFNV